MSSPEKGGGGLIRGGALNRGFTVQMTAQNAKIQALFIIMEKSCSKKKGQPPNRVNLSKRLYEKYIDPFA